MVPKKYYGGCNATAVDSVWISENKLYEVISMKKTTKLYLAWILAAAMLAGCGAPAATEPPTTEAPQTTAPVETTAPTEAVTEPAVQETVSENGYNAEYVQEIYAEQIGRYYTALTEQWDMEQYFDNEMTELPFYYYDGDPLENVGFGYQDLNNDGQEELVIGAILNSQQDPVVFEVWTVVDGAPVMLARSGSRNRYILQFVEEDNMWYVTNEASNGAANFATYSLLLVDGKLEVSQGIIFDAAADEQNPWFMTYDLDWDVSNDEPVDEELANAIVENERRNYTALEYIPYSLYK